MLASSLFLFLFLASPGVIPGLSLWLLAAEPPSASAAARPGVGGYQGLADAEEDEAAILASRAIQDMNALAQGVRLIFHTQSDYGTPGLDITRLLRLSRDLPQRLRTPPVMDPFGGTYTLTSQGNRFEVSLPTVPQRPCVLIVHTFGRYNGEQVAAVATRSMSHASTTFPLTLEMAQAACDQVSNRVTVVFR